MPPPSMRRRHDLDALRVFACYLLFVFHVGMVWSAAASLRARGAGGFLRERVAKLLVPLVAGCLLLAPGIKYLELRSGFDLNHRGLWVSQELQASFRSSIGVELPLAEPFGEGFFEFLPSGESLVLRHVPVLRLPAGAAPRARGARPKREWRRALSLALAAMGLLLAAVLGLLDWPPLLLVGSALAGWCFVVALLGFARERVTAGSPRLDALAESAFPIYLLHQPVIVFLGFAVVRLPLGIAAKFALLLAASVALTLVFYQRVIRPFRPARFLAGMPAGRAAGPRPGPGPAPAAQGIGSA